MICKYLGWGKVAAIKRKLHLAWLDFPMVEKVWIKFFKKGSGLMEHATALFIDSGTDVYTVYN